jgi:hypothetical protein
VVEGNFAWIARLAPDFKRTPETLRGIHFLAYAILMMQAFAKSIAQVL